MTDRLSLARRFEEVCRSLLSLQQSVPIERVEPFAYNGRGFGFDFKIDGDDGIVIVEVKLYRATRVQHSWLARSVDTLHAAAHASNARRAILMVSALVSDQEKALAASRSSDVYVNILDIADLAQIARKQPVVLDALGEVFAEATNTSIDHALLEGGDSVATRHGSGVEDFAATATISKPTQGAQLCAAVKAVPKSSVKQYEIAMEKALKYIFDGHLSKWRSQNVQKDDLRPDLTQRFNPMRARFGKNWCAISQPASYVLIARIIRKRLTRAKSTRSRSIYIVRRGAQRPSSCRE